MTGPLQLPLSPGEAKAIAAAARLAARDHRVTTGSAIPTAMVHADLIRLYRHLARVAPEKPRYLVAFGRTYDLKTKRRAR